MDWRPKLEAYIAATLPSARAVNVTRVGRLPAGASNETISLDLRLECDGTTFEVPLVLRPQRQDGLLAPYDIGRQFHVMRALASSDVCVPAVAWHEPTGQVLGTPFFLMERVKAETLPLFWYGPSERLLAAAAALARIHAVNWRGCGLEFLAPYPEHEELPSPLECDVAVWRARAERMRISRAPMLVALAHWLAEHEPADARHALLHGDPNPGNYLFAGEQVAAVIDWELAAIGDPRSDLGFYSALLTIFGGFPGDRGRTLLSDAYEETTGSPLTHLEYYEALGLYKMAVVMSGWAGPFGRGTFGMDRIGRRLEALLGPNWAM
ncbi:MAG: phosphotransferase family protein [Dehalococcoidia bacterium]|nr:phosphotransferase family protein [Dehalococcoidia bacterium]